MSVRLPWVEEFRFGGGAGEIDFSKIQALAKENGNINVDIPKVDLPKVPENNLKLVKPYAAKVREWIPMAMLGF